jgi:hypothetical protein
MTDALLQLVDEPMNEVEFIGFESTPVVEASDQPAEDGAKLPVPAKPRRRRAAKAHKRTHPVRVMFDDDEFLKLNVQADAQGMALQEYVRRSALRDPRVRVRPAISAAEDLFARDKVVEMTVARILVPLSPDLERRISAYFLPADGSVRERTRLGLPHLVARLGHLMTGLISPRWSGHRATPPAGT